MVEMVPSPWANQFEALLRASRSSVVICSPYIGRGPCDRMVRCLTRSGSPPTVHLLTDLSTDNLLSGVTDAAALLTVVESLPSVFVRYLPRLHAKVYVRDEAEALVTSGNMTDSGLSRNHELGIRILDSAVVAQERSHVTHLAELGAEVSADDLRAISEAAADLQQQSRAAEASARKSLKEAFDKRVDEVKATLRTLRVTGRTFHAIVSETILLLLRNGPMTPSEIHNEVQRLHSDLCDNTIKRVIHGESYGKKWKHTVRQARDHLKNKGLIALPQKKWSLVR